MQTYIYIYFNEIKLPVPLEPFKYNDDILEGIFLKYSF